MRTPKTTGLQWLEHSIAAINGTRYATRNQGGEVYLSGYIAYKTAKKKDKAVQLAHQYWHAILPLCEEFANREYEPRPEPEPATDKQLNYIRMLEIRLGRKPKTYKLTKKKAITKIQKLVKIVELRDNK